MNKPLACNIHSHAILVTPQDYFIRGAKLWRQKPLKSTLCSLSQPIQTCLIFNISPQALAIFLKSPYHFYAFISHVFDPLKSQKPSSSQIFQKLFHLIPFYWLIEQFDQLSHHPHKPLIIRPCHPAFSTKTPLLFLPP